MSTGQEATSPTAHIGIELCHAHCNVPQIRPSVVSKLNAHIVAQLVMLCLFVFLFRSEKQPAYHVSRLLVSLARLGRSPFPPILPPLLTEGQRCISPALLYVKGKEINVSSRCVALS